MTSGGSRKRVNRFVTGHTVPVDGGMLAASGWYRRKGWTNLPTKA